MPDLSTPGAQVRAIPKGIVARAAEAVRYVISGVAPTTWFGPMQPLRPFAPEGTGGRAWDYPVGYNLQYQPRYDEPISFSDLHALADNCDMLRLVIETRKDQVEGQDWDVRPRKLPDGTHPKAGEFATQITEAKGFFAFPDKEHDLASWIRAVAEEMFVTDAVSIFVRPDRKGRVYGFDVIDGSTVSPRIDAWGRTPQAPDVAYQQILHGVPAADFSRDQLVYYPRNKRPGHVYGYSPVEQVIMTANTLIRREMHQLAFYTDGNLTDGIFTSPPSWTKDQIEGWQNYWNSLFVGNLAARRQGMWVPAGVDYKQLKAPNLKDPFDEFLARLICFAFSISPQPFVSMMNRATAETAHDAAIEEGLMPILNYFRRLFRILFDRMGWTGIEMVPVDDREVDAATQSEIDVADVKAGIRTINEVRTAKGLDPIPGGDIPMVETTTGYVDIRANIIDPNAQQDPEPGPDRNDLDARESGADKAAGGPLRKKNHGKIVRKLPAIKEGAVARGAKEAIAERCTEALAKLGKSVARQVREKLSKTDDDPNQRAQDISDGVSLDELDAISADIADDLASVAAQSGQLQLAQLALGNDAMFGVVNTRAVSWANDHAAELVTKIGDSTRAALRELIASDLESGKTIEDIATDIGNMKVGDNPAFGEARADLIANVEVANANEAGALKGLEIASENGVTVRKTWLLGVGACVVCIANAAAGPIPLAAPFPSGDLAPTAHPHCRCALGAEVEEDAGAGESALAIAA